MLEYINSILSGIFLPIMLCATGIFYSLRLKFFYIVHPLTTFSAMRSEHSDGISSATAVAMALAGTLGVGNIVGVSSAIQLGGFGAIAWMWFSALLAMILKYAEIVIAMRYRTTDKDGNPVGSAMLYIKAFFSSRGARKLGSAVTAVFAVAFLVCSFTMGSMLQANAATEIMHGAFNVPRHLTGAVLAILTAITVRHGMRGTVKLTNLLVPVMSIGYAVISLAVIIMSHDRLGNAFYLIFSNAFTLKSAVGGIGGFAFIRAIRYGAVRGLVSNEAGCGTAPTAHSVANASMPARQGVWGIFEVFTDTVLLCGMTALVVIINYEDAEKYLGNHMMMTVSAYSASLGSFAVYFLCAAVLCFAFATIVCWSHYGLTAAQYLCPRSRTAFYAAYCVCVFLGSCVPAELPWQLSDISMSIMTVINLAVISCMSEAVKAETRLLFKSKKIR